MKSMVLRRMRNLLGWSLGPVVEEVEMRLVKELIPPHIRHGRPYMLQKKEFYYRGKDMLLMT
jgi:hypothetical protein